MNARTICTFVAAAILVVVCRSVTLAQQERAAQLPNGTPSTWKTVKGMSASAAESLEKSSNALKEIDRLMAQKTVSLGITLSSAETAFLLGAPSRAITIMEQAVREYPAEKMPGVQFPVAVVGNFWIGTFARHAGDATRAEVAYRDVLAALKTKTDIKGPSVLAAICYLYLAEIETHFRNRPEMAMSSRKGARAGGEKGATWIQE